MLLTNYFMMMTTPLVGFLNYLAVKTNRSFCCSNRPVSSESLIRLRQSPPGCSWVSLGGVNQSYLCVILTVSTTPT